jgi:hypothetical protein
VRRIDELKERNARGDEGLKLGRKKRLYLLIKHEK